MEAMRFVVPRVVVVSVLVAGALAPGTPAITRDRTPGQQSAMVRFEHLTCVAGEMLIGSYVIVHDKDKMARGEPCTALYRAGGRMGPLDQVVSFHCIPRERKVVSSSTTTIGMNPVLGVDTLIEYQFAGDSEGHGVPILAFAPDRSHVPASGVTAW
jgi:hypothetical protein